MKSSIDSTTQLARELGVSRWSVSRALNHQPGLKEATAERIREAARQHGFTPSILGRGLRAGKTDLVGVCVPDLVDYFLTNKVTRLREAISTRGLHAVMQMINTAPAEENAALERFAAMRCCGVVTIASRLHRDDPGIRSLRAAGIPLVQIDPLYHETHGVVITDRIFAMRQAIAHFQQLGHRKLAAMGFNLENAYGRQRIRGLLWGCRDWKWDFRRDVLLLDRDCAGDDFAKGAVLAREYLALGFRRPSAILALNDRLALGAMRELQKAGLQIPHDVSILGYDNVDFCAYTNPPLSSVDPQESLLVNHAVEMLGTASTPKTGGESLSVRVEPQLVCRESTGPIAPPIAPLYRA